ncbi:MAG TPA: glycosyltransferase family 4 protein [Gaiellaceae bacterium]|nr:glycosyltransferase family 4 protein [Gaiellaceae bacterium]
MRVVFNLLDADVGGGQRVAARVARALVERGDEVGVAVPADGPAVAWFTELGAPVHIVDLLTPRRAWNIPAAARVFRDYDVVYSHSSAPGAALAGSAARRAKRAHVIHQHIYPHFSSNAAVGAVQRRLYARAAADAAMIAVAQHVADAAIAAGAPADRVTVVPNGVDVPEVALPPRLTEPRVGMLARIDVQKGIDIFLDAVDQVRGPAKFALGTPTDDDPMVARARALGVDVVAPATRAFLDGIDVFVAPSRWEGHPLTLMEAMALGKAVVATSIPGVTEMLEGTEAGVLIPPEDSEALAAAIDELAADPALRTGLGARARALVAERYATPVVNAQITAILDRARAPS